MVQNLLYTSGVVLLIFAYNKFYFLFYKKKIVFYNYFIKFIYYTLLNCVFIYFFFDFKKLQYSFLESLIGLYLISFISIFFTVSLKSYESPTALIYKLVKRKTNFQKLHKYLKQKKIISSRIGDLKNQKLIKEKNNNIYLSPLGLSFSKFYTFLMRFLGIKSKG